MPKFGIYVRYLGHQNQRRWFCRNATKSLSFVGIYLMPSVRRAARCQAEKWPIHRWAQTMPMTSRKLAAVLSYDEIRAIIGNHNQERAKSRRGSISWSSAILRAEMYFRRICPVVSKLSPPQEKRSPPRATTIRSATILVRRPLPFGKG